MSHETTPPSAEPARKPKKALLLAAVIVIGLGGGGAAGAFMAGPLLAGKVPPAAAAGDSAADGEEGDGGAAAAEGEEGGSNVVLVDNMVLNPAKSGGQRFLLVSIGISARDADVAEQMKGRDPELRDAILRYLGAMQVEELSDVARRDSLKLGVRAVVAERFGKGSVRDVYFPQFVIQ